MNTIRGAVRYKDGSKHLIDVSNVSGYQEAREALLNQPNVTCALAVVPKIFEIVDMEPQPA